MAGPESRIRSRIREEIIKLGGLCDTQHGSAYTGRGHSDLWAVVDGVPFVIEVKTAVGVAKPKQKQYIRQARRAGACAFIVRDPHSALRAVRLRLKGKDPTMSGLEELDLSFMKELEASLGTEPEPEPTPPGPSPEPAPTVNGYDAMADVALGEGKTGYDDLIELIRELTATVKLLVEVQRMQADLYVASARAAVMVGDLVIRDRSATSHYPPPGTGAFPDFNPDQHIQETEAPKRRRRSPKAEA